MGLSLANFCKMRRNGIDDRSCRYAGFNSASSRDEVNMGFFGRSNQAGRSLSIRASYVPLGFATGGVMLMLLGRVKTQLVGSHENLENYLPFEDVNRKGWLPQFPNWMACTSMKFKLTC